MFNHVLMLCVGNICRSPMAEALLRHKMKKDGLSLTVSSAGLQAVVGHEVDKTVQTMLLQKGLDLSSHRARQLVPKMLFEADLVLTMTTDQQAEIQKTFPTICGRVHRLGKWAGVDIPDPYQRPQVIFELALTLIEEGINDWYRMLQKSMAHKTLSCEY